MPLSNITQLLVFREAARCHNLSQAAKLLRISQPAVSAHIRRLEDEVGFKVLERVGRRMALTEQGAALLERANELAEAMERLEAEVSLIKGEMRGHLFIGASTVWEYLLPKAMVTFQERYPQVEFSLAVSNTASIADRLLQRELSLAFVGDDPRQPSFVVQRLMDDELILVAGAQHPLAHHPAVSPAVLSRHRFIVREPDSATSQISIHYLEQLGVQLRTDMTLGSHEAVKSALRAGTSLAMLSKYAVLDELEAGVLTQIALQAPPCTRPLYCLRNTQVAFSLLQRTFLDWAAQMYPNPTNSSAQSSPKP